VRNFDLPKLRYIVAIARKRVAFTPSGGERLAGQEPHTVSEYAVVQQGWGAVEDHQVNVRATESGLKVASELRGVAKAGLFQSLRPYENGNVDVAVSSALSSSQRTKEIPIQHVRMLIEGGAQALDQVLSMGRRHRARLARISGGDQQPQRGTTLQTSMEWLSRATAHRAAIDPGTQRPAATRRKTAR